MRSLSPKRVIHIIPVDESIRGVGIAHRPEESREHSFKAFEHHRRVRKGARPSYAREEKTKPGHDTTRQKFHDKECHK